MEVISFGLDHIDYEVDDPVSDEQKPNTDKYYVVASNRLLGRKVTILDEVLDLAKESLKLVSNERVNDHH